VTQLAGADESHLLSRFHCSTSGGRSFVDPVSNLTVVSGFELDQHLSALLQRALPTELVPTFLHEATHHWCFSSPVGAALALLHLRATRAALRGAAGEAVDDTQCIDDLLRFTATVELLRPLAEGLALLAEFDAVPGRASFSSSPLDWLATYMYRFEKPPTPAVLDSAISNLLFNARLDVHCIERRESLLGGRVRGGEDSYLLGYLAIKSLWMNCARQSELGQDPDVVLAFLRSYVYDDCALAWHLLNDERFFPASINVISDYVQRRLRALLSLDLKATLAKFAAGVSSSLTLRTAASANREPSRQVKYWESDVEGIEADEELSAAGKRLILNAVLELHDDSSALSPFDQALRTRHVWVLAKREMLCLGSIRCTVRINEHGRALVIRDGSEPEIQRVILAGPAIATVSVGAGIGESGAVHGSTGARSRGQRPSHRICRGTWARDRGGRGGGDGGPPIC